jgi:hypothetical protein
MIGEDLDEEDSKEPNALEDNNLLKEIKLKWDMKLVKQMQGKLNCNQCKKEIGDFNWNDHRCDDCERYVAPSFKIPKIHVIENVITN